VVDPINVSWPAAVALLLAETATPKSLPPATRAAALMSLVVIVLIGVLFIAAILVGGHWVRRQGSVRRGSAVPPDRAPLATPSKGAQTAETETEIDDEADADDLVKD
jgi:hypothetical protein